TLCEPCSFSHDPSHNLVRARTPLSIPEHGSPAPDHNIPILLMLLHLDPLLFRFYRRGDRSFRKAEKQRLKAEKRLLKAEVKEIRKQLRMERRAYSGALGSNQNKGIFLLLPRRPKRPCPLVVPAMTAAFLDENLPDGTRLRPGTKFIKYWKMRNTGTLSWSADTKLKFMWGNLAVGSGDRWREVSVPFLQPGQVGIVSVALCAPTVEGSYTSHWRLAHAGEQFGPRVWCSIVVDPLAPAPMMADGILVSPYQHTNDIDVNVCLQGKNPVAKDGKACAASREQPLLSVDQEEYYIPSVDLLTAQDLLSFELLDINIVQELESAPTNTPADMTPCMSPLSQDGPLLDKGSPSLGLIQEETEVINSIMGNGVPILLSVLSVSQEEGEDDISGTQFVCETVIRSMTLEEAPDHIPLRGSCPGTGKGHTGPAPREAEESHMESICVESRVREKQEEEEKRGVMRSRSSSTSSEDYIIILPDCFDTSRPLGESMYRYEPWLWTERRDSAAREREADEVDEAAPGMELSGASSANDMLCTSQTLDDEPLTPEVVTPPKAVVTDPGDPRTKGLTLQMFALLRQQGLTGGLVKGALSVAASAYKALFTGQGPTQVTHLDTMMAVLVEMGFADRPLNQRLLKKHNYSLLDVVNELVQMTDNDWYSTRY
uniref:NBR1 autophagy cargo receptor b n=1 Tax=Oreochromis niloticus TaxID=8128 RepID=A0A669AY01_ORENI